MSLKTITSDVERVARELAEAGKLRKGQLLVVGASTSEVIGQRIGTMGSMEAAAAIFRGLQIVRDELGLELAFQCCEHLNRALVIEQSYCDEARLEPVTVIPVPQAGGSMAAYAYSQMREPCVVETIRAHAGIDIGDTLIGMHLRQVAVPFRPTIRSIGSARITAAYTRPKLIGGARALYKQEGTEASHACD